MNHEYKQFIPKYPMYRVVYYLKTYNLGTVINIRDKKYLKAFGNNLKRLRKEQGLSQEELNLEAGVGKNQVGLIERGEINISISTLKKLAEGLNLEPKDLLDF